MENRIGNQIPPQSKDAEISIIGGIMLSNDSFHLVNELLPGPEAFYDDNNKAIYETMQEMVIKNIPIDLVTLSEELKNKNKLELIGGIFGLIDITKAVPTSANIEFHARIVFEKYLKRLLIQTQVRAVEKAYDDNTDAFGLLDETEETIDKVKNQLNRISSIKTSRILTEEVFTHIKKLRSGVIKPFTTKLYDLDTATGGHYEGEFIIIAGRPGMGKSALAQTIIRNKSIDDNIPGAIISLEMTGFQNVIRFCSMITGIPVKELRSAKFDKSDEPKIVEFFNLFQSAKLYIDCTSTMNPFELKSKVKIMKKKYDIQYLMIDYLQLMSGTAKKNSNRDTEMGEVSRMCKSLSKDLAIPVFALAQLNRGVELRKDKKPCLADLRESGNFEQDADTILFLYRPEYYNIDTIEWNKKKFNSKGITEVIIAKGRNTGTSSVLLNFQAEKTLFTTLATDYLDGDPALQAYNQVHFAETDRDELPF